MQTLFDPPPELPHNGTATSRAAAQTKAKSGSADTDRNRIAVFLHNEPAGATRQQLASVLSLNPDSVRPRVRELIEGGWIHETGEVREWGGHQASKVLMHNVHTGGTR